MAALATIVRAVFAQRADPHVVEEQRLADWLAALPPEERSRLIRAHVLVADGHPTAIVEFLLIPRLHLKALTPWHVSSFSREISPDLWRALNNWLITRDAVAAFLAARSNAPPLAKPVLRQRSSYIPKYD